MHWHQLLPLNMFARFLLSRCHQPIGHALLEDNVQNEGPKLGTISRKLIWKAINCFFSESINLTIKSVNRHLSRIEGIDSFDVQLHSVTLHFQTVDFAAQKWQNEFSSSHSGAAKSLVSIWYWAHAFAFWTYEIENCNAQLYSCIFAESSSEKYCMSASNNEHDWTLVKYMFCIIIEHKAVATIFLNILQKHCHFPNLDILTMSGLFLQKG